MLKTIIVKICRRGFLHISYIVTIGPSVLFDQSVSAQLYPVSFSVFVLPWSGWRCVKTCIRVVASIQNICLHSRQTSRQHRSELVEVLMRLD